MGLGLLGGSLAQAARRFFPDISITGVSSAATVDKALRHKIIDRALGYSEVNRALENANLVVFCTPINNILQSLESFINAPPSFNSPCIITDVGSTKSQICELGQKVFEKIPNAYFIGSHPMAGSEKTGLDAADELLFENAPWILCPPPNLPDLVLSPFMDFTKGIGARPVCLDFTTHDRLVAHISHLPQFISTALAGFILEQADKAQMLQIAGSGLRDMTRLAESSFAVWEPIFNSNRAEVEQTTGNFLSFLQKLFKSFKSEKFGPEFEKSANLRTELLEHSVSLTSDLSEILVTIPDKTGILIDVLNPIVKLGHNILDLEIIKVREGESGTLRIGFKNQSEADSALESLTNLGFPARHR